MSGSTTTTSTGAGPTSPAPRRRLGETTGLSYTYTAGLTCGTDYSLGFFAEDAAGNQSILDEADLVPGAYCRL